MKCPRCGLNNLEHVTVCVKCNLSLINSTTDKAQQLASFFPPRAKKINWLRKLIWTIKRQKSFDCDFTRIQNKKERRFFDGARITFQRFFISFSIKDLIKKSPLIGANVIYPGSGEFISKQFILAAIFAIGALLALFGIITFTNFYYYTITSYFVYFFITLQTCSIMNVIPKFRSTINTSMVQNYEAFIANALVALLVFFACAMFTFNYSFPFICNIIGSDFNNNVVLDTINAADYTFITGDRVSISPQEEYKRGDIVLYTKLLPTAAVMHNGRIDGQRTQLTDNYDKVIGCPGEKVTIKDGIIFINDKKIIPQNKLSISNITMYIDCEVTLKKDEYFVYPSMYRDRYFKTIIKNQELYLVNKQDIRGRISAIIAPTSRVKIFK